jgi:hypothetical protein
MPRSRIIFLAIVGLAVAIVVVAFVLNPNSQLTPEQRNGTATAQTFANSATATAQYVRDNLITIRVNYGTEKRSWLEEATGIFMQENPNLRVQLDGQGSMEAYDAASQLKDDSTKWGSREIPTLWSPAAEIQVNLANGASQTGIGRAIAANCQRLVLSPNVIMVWEDRAKVFETFYKDKGGITLQNIYAALTDPAIKGSWEKLGGQSTWGPIKLGHTNPTQSNSGIMVLLMYANNFYQKTAPITVGEISADPFVQFLTAMETAVTTPLIASTGTLAEDVIVKGPAAYDFVLVYEALAIEHYKNAVSRQGRALRIVYPAYNFYSDHPICLVDHPANTAAQRDAAAKYQQFLLRRDIQELALKYGFRPADPNVPIFGSSAGTPSPFDDAQLRQGGLGPDIGQLITVPDGNTLRQLLAIWRRAFNA